MVNTVVEVALAAKLEPVGVDLVPFAMARAVGMPELGMEDEEGGEEAVVDIGATITNILVHEHGVTRFVRILPSGVGTSPSRSPGTSVSRTTSPSG